MHPRRRLPQPIRSRLWFTLIGAVVGAAYGHMTAVSDGRPLLGLGGLPRGVLTGVVISTLFSLEQVLARPRMAWLRSKPFLVHLAMKTAIYLVVILFGLSVGGWVFPWMRAAVLTVSPRKTISFLRQGKRDRALCTRKTDRRPGSRRRVMALEQDPIRPPISSSHRTSGGQGSRTSLAPVRPEPAPGLNRGAGSGFPLSRERRFNVVENRA